MNLDSRHFQYQLRAPASGAVRSTTPRLCGGTGRVSLCVLCDLYVPYMCLICLHLSHLSLVCNSDGFESLTCWYTIKSVSFLSSKFSPRRFALRRGSSQSPWLVMFATPEPLPDWPHCVHSRTQQHIISFHIIKLCQWIKAGTCLCLCQTPLLLEPARQESNSVPASVVDVHHAEK